MSASEEPIEGHGGHLLKRPLSSSQLWTMPPGSPRVIVLVRCDHVPVSPTRAPQVFLVLLAPPDCL